MVAGWFQRAKKVFGGSAKVRTPDPQPFAVTCDCGMRLEGLRASSVQKPACRTCGTTLFVLPICTYPLPASVRQRWSGVEEPATVKPRTSPKSPAKKKSSAAEAATVGPTTETAKPASAPDLLARPRAKVLTPLRVMALALVFSVGLTGYILYRQAAYSRAQLRVQGTIDRGTEAFQKGDFPTAAAELSEASAALDILRRRDAASLAIRRLASEAVAVDGLCRTSLPSLLAELSGETSSEDLATRFGRRFAGNWIILDAPVMPPAIESNAERPVGNLQVDLPLQLGEAPVQILLTDWRWPALISSATSESPQRVLFAAQLDRLEPPSAKHPTSRLWLRGSTAVLWSQRDSLEAIGLWPNGVDEQATLEELLAKQGRQLDEAR